MANLVRKQNKRTLDKIRTQTAKIEYDLEFLEKQYAPEHPDLGTAIHTARELNALLDDLVVKINEQI